MDKQQKMFLGKDVIFSIKGETLDVVAFDWPKLTDDQMADFMEYQAGQYSDAIESEEIVPIAVVGIGVASTLESFAEMNNRGFLAVSRDFKFPKGSLLWIDGPRFGGKISKLADPGAKWNLRMKAPDKATDESSKPAKGKCPWVRLGAAMTAGTIEKLKPSVNVVKPTARALDVRIDKETDVIRNFNDLLIVSERLKQLLSAAHAECKFHPWPLKIGKGNTQYYSVEIPFVLVGLDDEWNFKAFAKHLTASKVNFQLARVGDATHLIFVSRELQQVIVSAKMNGIEWDEVSVL